MTVPRPSLKTEMLKIVHAAKPVFGARDVMRQHELLQEVELRGVFSIEEEAA
jgi:hypothetical protein